MTTMAEFKKFPRITIRTITGWQSGVSCNTPARVVKAQIIYTTKAGDERVFGEATAKTKVTAVAKAYDAALKFFDAE
jgi:hypothetical protein